MKYYRTAADCERGFRADPNVELDEFAAARQACHNCVGAGNVFVAQPAGATIELGCQASLPGPQDTRASLAPLALGIGLLAVAWWAYKG